MNRHKSDYIMPSATVIGIVLNERLLQDSNIEFGGKVDDIPWEDGDDG